MSAAFSLSSLSFVDSLYWRAFDKNHIRALFPMVEAHPSITQSRLMGSTRWLLRKALLASRGSPFRNHNRRRSPHKNGGIVVSTIHGATKFHTSKGTGTVFSMYEPPEIDERMKKPKATCSKIAKNVLSCRDAKERIIVNTKRKTLQHGVQVERVQTRQTHQAKEALVRLRPQRSSMQRGRRTYKGKKFVKACPKDGYPLPEIDWKVESLSGFRLKCFLDAYKGYHQIKIAEEDEVKIVFFARKEVFCYRKCLSGYKMRDPSIKGFIFRISHYKARNKGQPIEDQGSNRFRASKNAQRYTEPQYEASSTQTLPIESPEGKECTYALRFKFKTTNNEAEHKALLAGLWIAREIEIKSPSQTDNIIKEVHKGSCGFNMEPHSMVVRIIKQGYNSISCKHYSKEHVSKDKRKEAEGRKVASVKEAYYWNKLRRATKMVTPCGKDLTS
nr:reverse transcriptase domain-containing protein [Tanacetum cinerariifolium]